MQVQKFLYFSGFTSRFITFTGDMGIEFKYRASYIHTRQIGIVAPVLGVYAAPFQDSSHFVHFVIHLLSLPYVRPVEMSFHGNIEML